MMLVLLWMHVTNASQEINPGI